MTSPRRKVDESVAFLKKWIGNRPLPQVAVVLGSGLADTISSLGKLDAIGYKDIPGFRAPSVTGHSGQLIYNSLYVDQQEKAVVYLSGRNHLYEGHSMAEVVHNVRTAIALGAQNVILTNAAGCLNTDWEIGRYMLITDHINHTGQNPLTNGGYSGFGERFVDMTTCYSPDLQDIFKNKAQELGQPLHEGVYFGVLGCSYETPAEIRMMQTLGASAVGMSTVLEAIAARQMGAKVAGFSCLTNYGAGLKHTTLDHSEVVVAGKKYAEEFAILLQSGIKDMLLQQ